MNSCLHTVLCMSLPFLKRGLFLLYIPMEVESNDSSQLDLSSNTHSAPYHLGWQTSLNLTFFIDEIGT